MAPAPRISVVLPSYNHVQFVEQAIESVLSQSFGDLELIVTDDGSTDGTVERIRLFSDPRINFLALPANRGYSAALDACLARARGELVALLCSDDFFLPGKIERQVAFLDANPGVAAVFGKPMFVGEDGQPCAPGSHPFEGLFIDDLSDRFAWLRQFYLHGNALCHPTALLRRAVCKEVGGYDRLLVQLQDYDYWIRTCATHEIRVLDEQIVGYRVLGAERNTSWPTLKARRRDRWEMLRVLRRFLAFDETLVLKTFGAELTEYGISADLPSRVILGLLAARTHDPVRQAFALRILEDAVEDRCSGIDYRSFNRLKGELDPFAIGLLDEVVGQKSAAEGAAIEQERRAIAAEGTAIEQERRAIAAEGTAIEQERRAIAAKVAAEQERRAIATEVAAEQERRAAAEVAADQERRAAAEVAAEQERRATAEVAAEQGRRATAEALVLELTSSTIWRSSAPLRRLAAGSPTLRRLLRQGLKAAYWTATLQLPSRLKDIQAHRAGIRPDGDAIVSPLNAGPDVLVGVQEEQEAEGAHEPAAVLPAAAPSGLDGPLLMPLPVSAVQPVSEVLTGRRPEWEHVPEGWRPDDPRGLGWEHPSVVEVQVSKWRNFVALIESTRPLGVYHEAAQLNSENPAAHNFVLAFSYVLARAAAGRGSLSVLDWGGGLGHYAVIARAALPEIALDYTVFDLPGVCAAGRRLQPEAHFTSDAEATLSRRYDLIFASGSLQYVVDWKRLLGRFADAAERWVFLSRTPFVDLSESFVVVQRPHSAGYCTDYLSRVFNRGELLYEAAAAGLELEREFLMVGERVVATGAPEPFDYRGFLLRSPHLVLSALPPNLTARADNPYSSRL